VGFAATGVVVAAPASSQVEVPLMFRTLTAFVVGVALVAFVGTPAFADDKEDKEVKLEGKITCAKCDLGVADSCHTVIKVGEKVYYFDKDGTKKYHKEICTTPKDGTVTGKVKKEGDKMIVTVSKVDFK
jgi:Family of unknown function (DUF6370)